MKYNIIHEIPCAVCPGKYIEQNNLKARLNAHKSDCNHFDFNTKISDTENVIQKRFMKEMI